MTDLKALRAICEAATPGPWNYDHGNWQVEQLESRDGVCDLHYQARDTVNGGENPIDPVYDGEFIATFNPSKVLELISELEKARLEIERLNIIVSNRSATDRAIDDCLVHGRGAVKVQYVELDK